MKNPLPIWTVMERRTATIILVCIILLNVECFSEGMCWVETVSQWYTGSGSIWSPFLRCGMQHQDGVITVPTSGLYYVYGQIQYIHSRTSDHYAGFRITVNGNYRVVAYRHHKQLSDFASHYTGRIIQLNRNDKLSMTFIRYSYYYFHSHLTFFGVFSVNWIIMTLEKSFVCATLNRIYCPFIIISFVLTSTVAKCLISLAHY